MKAEHLANTAVGRDGLQRRGGNVAILLALAWPMMATAVEPPDRESGHFGLGAPSASLEEIPIGSELRRGVEGLSAASRQNALRQLAGIPRQDADHLRTDRAGRLFYVCPEPSPRVAPVATALPVSIGTAVADVPVAEQPAYHSRPGAAKRIFLDFRGGIVANTAWNPGKTWDCMPYNHSGVSTTFDASEQADIQAIWKRVAESYVPYDVDVTTDPATPTGPALGTSTAWLMITHPRERGGELLPHDGSGGVAFVNIFGAGSNVNCSPTWVGGDYGTGDIAVIAAHESGHNMGLSHDGQGTAGYYGGFAGAGALPSWGPIMGTPYGRTLTHWSHGEYTGATNAAQDDLAVIAGKLSFRPAPSTTALVIAGGAFSAPASSCLIRRSSESNRFTVACADWSILTGHIDPTRNGGSGSLYASLTVLDAAGLVLATAMPTSSAAPAISSLLVPAGTYTLLVSSVGSGDPMATPPAGFTPYGSVGTYALSGTLTTAGRLTIAGPGAVPITSGDTSPSIGDGTDFGQVFAGTTATTTFTLGNTGSGALTLGAIALSGSGSACFSIDTVPPPGTALAAGGTKTIAITYHAPAGGVQQQAQVLVPIPGTATRTFTIQGVVGHLPVITGPGMVGGIVGRTLTATLTMTEPATSFIVVDPPPGMIVTAAGVLTGTPTTAGTWATRITPVNAFSASHGPAPTATITVVIGTGPAHIAVTGTGGAVIADGDASPTTVDGTDFGRTYAGATSAPARIFTIANDGLSPLIILAPVTVTGDGATPFAVITQPQTFITAGSTGTVALVYHALASGAHTATVSIPSNVGTFTFTVRGTVGTLPSITGPTAIAGVVGEPLSATLTTTDQATSFQASDPPPGITLDDQGRFSGIPTQAGTWSTQVSAGNEFSAAHGPSSTVSVSFAIVAAVADTTEGGGGRCGLGFGSAFMLMGSFLLLRLRLRH